MSMSGGGVGGNTGPSPILTPATSPAKAVPVASCRYATWCEAWPGVYSTRNAVDVALAALQDAHPLLGHRR